MIDAGKEKIKKYIHDLFFAMLTILGVNSLVTFYIVNYDIGLTYILLNLIGLFIITFLFFKPYIYDKMDDIIVILLVDMRCGRIFNVERARDSGIRLYDSSFIIYIYFVVCIKAFIYHTPDDVGDIMKICLGLFITSYVVSTTLGFVRFKKAVYKIVDRM